MRLAVCVLACVAASAMTPALADPEANAPSATPAASAAPAAPAAAPAATPAAATTPVAAHPAASTAPAAGEHPAVEIDAAQMDQLEKHFVSEGYKVEMHNGEKIYCRREAPMGSRISSGQHCGTVAELASTTQEGREGLERTQRNTVSPMPH